MNDNYEMFKCRNLNWEKKLTYESYIKDCKEKEYEYSIWLGNFVDDISFIFNPNTKILRFVTNDGNYLFYVDTLIDATKMVESYIKGMKIDLTHSRVTD